MSRVQSSTPSTPLADSNSRPVSDPLFALEQELLASNPPDLIRAKSLVSNQAVIDVSFVDGLVSAEVHEGGALRVSLQMLTDDAPTGSCPQCGENQRAPQLCVHVMAAVLAARGAQLQDGGGDRLIVGAGQEMADGMLEAAVLLAPHHAPESSVAPSSDPAVAFYLGSDTGMLALQVTFDGDPYLPHPHDADTQPRRPSQRTLDQVILSHIDGDGIWDEALRAWTFSSGAVIETVLGLISEYQDVYSLRTKQKISFSPLSLDARITIEWQATGAEFSLSWVTPKRELIEYGERPIGGEPYFMIIDNTVYRVSSYAGRLAKMFPDHARISIPRAQLGPVLELLTKEKSDTNVAFVHQVNPAKAPALEIGVPAPTLVVTKAGAAFGMSSAPETGPLTLVGILKFVYPTAKPKSNVVVVPDRAKEAEYIRQLSILGFKLEGGNTYKVSGDHAVELIHQGAALFDDSWHVDGLEQLKAETKFVNLALDIALAEKETGPIDWFEASISLTQNKAKVPLSLLFKNRKAEGEKWIKLDTGAYAMVPGGSLSELRATLGVLDPNFEVSQNIKAKVSRAQALSLSRSRSDELRVSLDARLTKLSKSLDDFTAIKAVKPPKGFTGGLRSYQEEGLSWLTFISELELGGILADEMGLGKTVQALAFLQHAKRAKGKNFELKRPALVIAPTSVVMNWMYEARRFTPDLNVILLQGPKRKQLFAQIPEADLVISSYALLRNDRFDLERHEFSYLILDEAQNIKNPDAAVTKAAKSLKAKRRLALTGTPTENRPLELWSIFDFVMPGYLGSIEYFKNHIERPMLEMGPAAPTAKMLYKKTKPFVLRRRKAEVEKQLPPKIESVLPVEMTDAQKAIYVQILEEVKPKVFDEIEKKGVKGASVSILAALLRLRQVCNHPASISALKTVEGLDSGKFNALKELLTDALENGRKILLFSQFLDMLGIIKGFLEESGVKYLYLDGSVKERQPLIDQFNADESVRLFLISLKAGGTGLNLTAADTVVIYDPWWNPSVENQAVDRAHRIGQQKTVNVYRLVTEDSVEKKIMDLKEKKAKLFNALVDDQDGLSMMKLSRQDLEEIFSNPFA